MTLEQTATSTLVSQRRGKIRLAETFKAIQISLFSANRNGEEKSGWLKHNGLYVGTCERQIATERKNQVG
jgi:hypothetical protein